MTIFKISTLQPQNPTRGTVSCIGGMFTFTFAGESHYLAGEYINANDVITFCLHLRNKMRRNLIKIRSCAIFRWMMSLPFVFIS